MEKETCTKCKTSIDVEEYIENGGYCKKCIEEIEKSNIEDTKNTSNNNNTIAIAVIIGFCIILLLSLLMQSIGDGSFGGSSKDKYQQKQVNELKDDLYRKSTDGKYYHRYVNTSK